MPSRTLVRLALGLACAGGTFVLAAHATPAWAEPATAAFTGTVVELLAPSGVVAGGPKATLHLVALNSDGSPVVGLRGKVTTDSGTAGELTDLGGGSYSFPYTPGKASGIARLSLKTKLAGKSLERSWSVRVSSAGPTALEMAVNPARITLKQDSQASLVLSMTGGEGQGLASADAIIRVSAGEVKNLTHLGGGQFNAMYVPPAVPYPHLSLITAVDRREPTKVYGATALPLVGRVEFPVEVAPNARVILRVAGRDFGPVVADANGRVKVPIEVPPGVATGTLVQVLPDGTRKENAQNLNVPETRRVAMFPVAAAIPAEGRVQVPVRAFVAQPDGKPDTAAAAVFSATAGVISAAKHVGGGVYEATFTAPSAIAATVVTLSVNLADKPSTQADSLDLELLPARATKLTLTTDRMKLPDTATGFQVFAKAMGSGDLGLGGRTLRFSASGAQLKDLKDLRNGDYQGIFTTTGTGPIELAAVLTTPDSKNPATRVLVLPGATTVAADGAANLSVHVVTLDSFGYTVANQPVNLSVTGDATVPASVTTGADGIGQIYLKAGRTPGAVTVSAERGESRGAATIFQANGGFTAAALSVSGDPATQALVRDWSSAIQSLRIEREGASGVAAAPMVSAGATAAKAARITLASEPTSVAPGGSVLLKVQLSDEGGRGVSGQALEFLASAGTVGPVQDGGGGLYTARFTAPANASADIKLNASTTDGAVFTMMKLPVGNADTAWAANPFGATQAGAASTAAGAAQAAPPATTPPVAPPPVAAPSAQPSATSTTTRSGPWLRVGMSASVGGYDFDQQPLSAATVLYPFTLNVSAPAPGLDVHAQAWVPGMDWLGGEMSVGANRYTLAPQPLCEKLERPCENAGEQSDMLLDVRALAAARYAFASGANRFWLGARAGWSRSDVRAYKVMDDTLSLNDLGVNALAVGPQVGADIGPALFLDAAFLEHLAGGSTPWSTEFSGQVGYRFMPGLYAAVGYRYDARLIEVSNANGDLVGELSDKLQLGRVSVGAEF